VTRELSAAGEPLRLLTFVAVAPGSRWLQNDALQAAHYKSGGRQGRLLSSCPRGCAYRSWAACSSRPPCRPVVVLRLDAAAAGVSTASSSAPSIHTSSSGPRREASASAGNWSVRDAVRRVLEAVERGELTAPGPMISHLEGPWRRLKLSKILAMRLGKPANSASSSAAIERRALWRRPTTLRP
jgi:hypothetical protein